MSAKRKVMIVEDQVLVGLDLVEVLAANGFDAHGPYKTVAEAQAAFDSVEPEFGVLDIHLGEGLTSEDVARRFRESGLPFVFVSGYTGAGEGLLNGFKDVPRLEKPVEVDALPPASAERCWRPAQPSDSAQQAQRPAGGGPGVVDFVLPVNLG